LWRAGMRWFSALWSPSRWRRLRRKVTLRCLNDESSCASVAINEHLFISLDVTCYIAPVMNIVSKCNWTYDATVMSQATNVKPVNRNVLNGNCGCHKWL
jgi:hypothetical protein